MCRCVEIALALPVACYYSRLAANTSFADRQIVFDLAILGGRRCCVLTDLSIVLIPRAVVCTTSAAAFIYGAFRCGAGTRG
jgi:hypothetical protein